MNIKNANWAIEQEDEEFDEADHIFLPSNFSKKTLINSGVDSKKIFVNPFGVDLKNFYTGKKLDHIFRIVQVGHVCLRKGSLYTMQAFNELNLPNSELYFIGSIDKSREFKKVLEKKSNKKIHFLGTMPQSQLVKIYQQCSIAILPSVSDGFGMVVPQAMACALPVIVSDSVGAMDIVEDGKNGFVTKTGNLEELKERILQLYENPDECKLLGRNAHQITCNDINWVEYGNRLAKFLINLKQ